MYTAHDGTHPAAALGCRGEACYLLKSFALLAGLKNSTMRGTALSHHACVLTFAGNGLTPLGEIIHLLLPHPCHTI